MSPTQRTLAFFRKQGFAVAITEHWNPFARIRQDLFGMIDILVLDPPKILGVQCTSRSNHSARVKKILANPCTKDWLLCNADLRVFSWKKGDKTPKVTTFEVSGDEIEAWDWK